jgi:hypothetical protein
MIPDGEQRARSLDVRIVAKPCAPSALDDAIRQLLKERAA